MGVWRLFVVGVCDHNESHRTIIKNCITSVFFETEDLLTVLFSRADEVMNYISTGDFLPDLMILDADKCGGLSLALSMKNEGIKSDIIIFTDSASYVFEGYKYKLFDYVLKSGGAEKLKESLDRYRGEKLRSDSAYLNVRSNGCKQNIRLDKIAYFESRGRKIAAVSSDERFEFYQKMDELMEILPKGQFVRCHQSYVVNAAQVYSYSSSSVVLLSGDSIPLSRRYYQGMKDIFEMSNMS